MKNFDKPIKIETFKHITLVYIPQLESIKMMMLEHYDKPEYDDTVFFINRIYYLDENGNPVVFKKSDFPQKRRIYYNFEHYTDVPLSDREVVANLVDSVGLTEIWSFQPNVEQFDTKLGLKFMPPRYTSYIKKSEIECEKTFDLGFVGIVGSPGYSEKRNKFFDTYITNTKYDFSIKILNGQPIWKMKDELANCKFILDSKRTSRQVTQNQVRLFEHLCLGHTILSEKSEQNYFPGLIHEWKDIDELQELIHTVEPQDMSEKYKEMTYTDEAYEQYRMDMLNNYYNIPTVNYFYGNNKPKRYDIINKLINKYNYKSYLEIGVSNGENFNKINCPSKVGIDPDPNSAATHHITSDEWFNLLLPDDKFDLIFIDGLHLWEQCYRDINNALNHLSPNGIIVCHDMNPLFEMYQSRCYNGGIWNGDVWKAFVKIRTERSDISTCMIEDCDFGLGIIRFGEGQLIRMDVLPENIYYVWFVDKKQELMNTISLDEFLKQNEI